MRKPILIGNWKMNGSLQANQALMVRVLPRLRMFRKSIDLAVCPPNTYLFQVRDLLGYTGIMLGAQNASGFVSGAYTGEVSATMLQEMGCRYVLVGHSERRLLFGESNQEVAARYRSVLGAGLMPVPWLRLPAFWPANAKPIDGDGNAVKTLDANDVFPKRQRRT